MTPVHNYDYGTSRKETVRVCPFLGQHWFSGEGGGPALPHAALLVGEFHLVALGNPMRTEVRRHATVTLGTRGAQEGPGVGLAPQLGYERLTARAVHPTVEPPNDTGEPGIEVLHACI